MNETLKMGVVLAIVCGIAAAGLKTVYSITLPVILENEKISSLKKRTEIYPQAVEFKEREYLFNGVKKRVWNGLDQNGMLVGTVIEISPRGYGGPIIASVGISNKDEISSIAINKMDQRETPGLGTKVTNASFRDQFAGKSGEALKLKKDGGEIDAITAATISSRAVAEGVKEGWQWYMKVKDQ